MPPEFIPAHGGYESLLSYRKSLIVFRGTKTFCRRFLSHGNRTIDQMVQAARSGKQNIIEGSMALGTSTETEIKLTGVARASLEELLEDYRDYARDHGAGVWLSHSPEVSWIRKFGRSHNDYEDYREFFETRMAAVVANIAICVIHQTNYLLDSQLRELQRKFVTAGGIRERMSRARRAYRDGRAE